MNIDERCYGYHPAQEQLVELRADRGYMVKYRDAWMKAQARVRELEALIHGAVAHKDSNKPDTKSVT